MKTLRIGIDVDGCLGNFNEAYADLLRKEGATIPTIDNYFPNTWHWAKALGISKELDDRVWKQIKESGTFWRNITPFEGTYEFLKDLAKGYATSDDIYFITHREGAQAKQQTEDWLIENGFDFNVTVLCTGDKGPVAKALGLTHFLDDRNENCLAVSAQSPVTKTYMYAQPWNQAQIGIPRIYDLSFFLRELAVASGQLVEVSA